MSVGSLARVGWVALAAGLAFGCELVTTVEPAIPDSEATFDARLLGTWISGSDEQVVVGRDGDGYRIAYTSRQGEVWELDARLGRVGGRTAVEIFPVDPGSGVPHAREASMAGAHLLLFLEFGADTLWFRMLDADSVRRMLHDGRLELPFEVRGHELLLTAPSNRLRSELGSLVGRPGVMNGGGPGKVWRPPTR